MDDATCTAAACAKVIGINFMHAVCATNESYNEFKHLTAQYKHAMYDNVCYMEW